MSDSAATQIPNSQQICFPQMPLAVYRELAAHLRQVNGVEVELLPQTAQTFDYPRSQVGGLLLHLPNDATASQQLVQQILAYYGQRHGGYFMIQPD